MSFNSKNITSLLLSVLVVIAILISAYLFSFRPGILLIVVISVIGLWAERKQLPSTVKRARGIIGVVFGVALFFGFLLWYLHGASDLALGLVLGVAVVIILSLGFYN